MTEIKSVGICNRGEVAVRIIRACQELGLESVLLHSEADKNSRAYRLADRTEQIGPSAINESYLNIENNIEAARRARVNAIHPGFGFLSENANFAQAVADAGMTFVGPSPKAIDSMGDKIKARALMIDAKVPVVPGYQGDDQSDDRLLKEAKDIGFPLIIKAAAGGGGRGLKVSESEKDFQSQLEAARREGKSAFGSDRVFLEKYLKNAKHIEFQILADTFGKTIHLFDRECSVQRRHQKIIEEALSPSLDDDLRSRMSAAAVRAAESVGYTGAGTVEFLFQNGEFFFLEMNTRLQVEHPVTEEVLGVDLVKAQLEIASGEKLRWSQEDLTAKGHSIECRLYAEDSGAGGMPSTGKILHQSFPDGPGRRFEYAFESQDHVTEYYDSMIAKIITYAEDRETCIQKTLRVLEDTVIFGVKTNIEYLKAILEHPEFHSGKMTTQFIPTHFPNGLEEVNTDDDEQVIYDSIASRLSPMSVSAFSENNLSSVFEGAWRNV